MEIQNKKLSDDVFYKERAEVLTQWPTGKDVDLEEAIAYHKAMPECRKFGEKLLVNLFDTLCKSTVLFLFGKL